MINLIVLISYVKYSVFCFLNELAKLFIDSCLETLKRRRYYEYILFEAREYYQECCDKNSSFSSLVDAKRHVYYAHSKLEETTYRNGIKEAYSESNFKPLSFRAFKTIKSVQRRRKNLRLVK